MFQSARLKLTAWYLLIIMVISGFFSVAFYQVSTQEIQTLINRIEQHQSEPHFPFFQPRPIFPFTIQELEEVKDRIKLNLFILNGFILLIAGGAGYFLAGRTLRPIQLMVDEQNLFISSASHELRTPIATMRAEMEASLLEKKLTEKNARELIKSNLEELQSLQDLSNDLLSLTQMHNKENTRMATVVDLQPIVIKSIHTLSPLAKKKKIHIIEQLQHAKIIGDEKRLRELFVILLDNAIKYSDQKKTIEFSIKNQGKQSIVQIMDQGRGISSHDLPHIFDRFYRANAFRNEDGYGLGLSIAKKIVDLHNGHIGVKSTSNKGTTFTLSFPLHT